MVALYRRLLTLPYIVANTILLWCLGLTLGLSERGSETLNVMKGIYGANILLIQTRADFTGTLTTTVPVSGERLETSLFLRAAHAQPEGLQWLVQWSVRIIFRY
jgi:hypothetical protein